jgi:hypothetical protein
MIDVRLLLRGEGGAMSGIDVSSMAAASLPSTDDQVAAPLRA